MLESLHDPQRDREHLVTQTGILCVPTSFWVLHAVLPLKLFSTQLSQRLSNSRNLAQFCLTNSRNTATKNEKALNRICLVPCFRVCLEQHFELRTI